MIAIIRYNAGNVYSVSNALTKLGANYIVTDNHEVIRKADKIIFPGVGEASSAMNYLHKMGLVQVLKDIKQPFLGICLGLQLMCTSSEEGKSTECLGIFEEKVLRFPHKCKVPHMGWNNFETISGELFKGVRIREDVYFVHSYYATIGPNTVATTYYGTSFSSGLSKNNFHAVQFHPEKSADTGAKIIQNFLSLKS